MNPATPLTLEDLDPFLQHLPDAVEALATALGLSPPALLRQIERGQVDAEEALARLRQVRRRRQQGALGPDS